MTQFGACRLFLNNTLFLKNCFPRCFSYFWRIPLLISWLACQWKLAQSYITTKHLESNSSFKFPYLKEKERGAEDKDDRISLLGLQWENEQSHTRIPHGSSPPATFLQKSDSKCSIISFKFCFCEVGNQCFLNEYINSLCLWMRNFFKLQNLYDWESLQ